MSVAPPSKFRNKRRMPPEVVELAPRIARRERRRERSREELVEAARRVLLRDGIGATTLAAVAQEVGLTKAALYYYYPSKDALFFEVMYGSLEMQARAVHDGVEASKDGGEALGAIIRETVQTYAAHLDDFRLTFLQSQFAGPGTVRFVAEQLARIRPLNDLAYAGATKMLAEERKVRHPRAHVDPRMTAFLASLAAIGLLTMKGLVESFGDPLLYTDEQLIEGFSSIFAAAP